MIATTRKLLLLSISALSIFAFAPVVPHGASVLGGFSTDAVARGGGDDHGGDSSGGGDGGSSGGGSGRGGSDDGASHDSGDDHGGGRHSGDDDSASDDDGSSHQGRHRGNDDVADDDSDDDSMDDNGGGRRSRPSVEISVSDESLRGLLSGSLRAVDNLGRTLEIEVETEHGAQVVIGKVHGGDAKRQPGAITSVTIVSVN